MRATLPLLEILRRAFRLEEGDTPGADRGQGRGGAGAALRLDPIEAAPYVLQMLGVMDGTDALTALGPEAVLARTTEILRQVAAEPARAARWWSWSRTSTGSTPRRSPSTPLVESLAGQPPRHPHLPAGHAAPVDGPLARHPDRAAACRTRRA